jgi:hypothetical protein
MENNKQIISYNTADCKQYELAFYSLEEKIKKLKP